MSVQLTINGITYNYPANNDSPPWGEEATDWATAVTDTLQNIQGTGDILQTVFPIANNVASVTNVIGLFFDPTTVRGAIIEYSVYRVTTSTGATELTEVGTLYIGYKNTANTWFISNVGGGFAGVTFSVTSGGQVQYVSTNMTGSTYSGIMHYRARALTQ